MKIMDREGSRTFYLLIFFPLFCFVSCFTLLSSHLLLPVFFLSFFCLFFLFGPGCVRFLLLDALKAAPCILVTRFLPLLPFSLGNSIASLRLLMTCIA